MNIAFYSRQQSFIDINISTYGVLDIDRGGTGLSFVNTGDILYGDGYNSLDTLSPSDDGYILTLAGGLPQWLPGGGGGSVNSGIAGRLALYPTTGTTVDDIYTQNANLIDIEIANHSTLASARAYTIPDSSADAHFVMTEGSQIIDGLKSFRSFMSASAMNVVNTDNSIAIEFRPGGSGQRNTFIGVDSGGTVSSGTENTALGNLALQNVASGSQNTAIGNRALYQNDADRNVGVGHNALEDNSIGSSLVAVGTSSLSNNTIGNRNTALGYASLGANTIGSDNTGIGSDVMQYATIGSRNVALGSLSMTGLIDGNDNIAIGYESLTNIGGGERNIAIGTGAASTVDTQSDIVAVGYYALKNNDDGYNTAIGSYALETNVIGIGNTALGYHAGRTAAGSNGVYIGREAGYSETEDDKLHIANSQSATLIYGDFVDGYVGINNTSPQHSISVIGDGHISQDLHLGIALDEIYGGTGKSSYSIGDILYADSTISLATLPIEVDGYVLTSNGGTPNWESLSDLTSAITISLDDEDEIVIPANATWGFVLVGDNEEYAHFTVNDDASVINLINYSVNVSTTDTNGFFVIYNNGSGLTFKNRLGSTKTVTYNLSNTAGATGGCSCDGDIVCTSVFADGYGGGSKDPAAIIQMDSTTQGFLPPRMTTVQRNAIVTPPEGLIVYDLDLHKLAYYNGTSWVQI